MSRRKRQIVRFRRLRVVHGDLAFDLTTSDPHVDLGIEHVAGTNERRHFQVRFQPSMSREHAAQSYLNIVQLTTKRCDSQLVILPHTNEKYVEKVTPEHNYLVFPTHAAKLDNLLIESLFLVICNVQLQGDVDTPIYNVEFRPPEHERFIELPYMPPVAIPGLAIDGTRWPPGNPLPFRAHKFTSSRIPRHLGFYGKDENITGWRAAAIRFGVQNEITGIFLYLDHFLERVYEQTGYHECEFGGAKPDGLVTDETTTIVVPDYPDLDPTKGILEVKASRTSTQFMASDFAQCVWELMACNRAWGDIVRYCETQKRNPVSGLWETVHLWRCVRLYRSKKLEEDIREIVHNGLDATEMRAHLEKVAHDANTLHSSVIEANPEVLEELGAYKRNYYAQHKRDVPTLDPILERIEKRQALVFEAFQTDKKKLHAVVLEQIQDCVELIK